MAEGPRLPRKASALKHASEAMAGVAYQIGVLLAVQRNRLDYTQSELGAELGLEQVGISRIENGSPLNVSDAKVAELFRFLKLDPDGPHANFVMWWRKNG